MMDEERKKNIQMMDEERKKNIQMIVEERKRNKKVTDELENRIDICETKIGMICYRDLIKDIIDYSFKYFKVPIKGENNLWNKVQGITELLIKSTNKSVLTIDEKKIYSNFIYISFLTLKNVNHNVHGGDGGYVSNYSISNFIECLKDYIGLYLLEILNEKKESKVSEIIKNIPLLKDVEAILEKIGFTYEDDFDCDII